ncbi:TBC24 protein, partial [Notiomystis cincta]|nr:TBC24 protein [Notiomystis cincta]
LGSAPVTIVVTPEAETWDVDTSSCAGRGHFVDWAKMPEPQQPARIPRDVLSRPPRELKRLAREGCWASSHAARARLYPRLIQRVSCRLVAPDALVYRDVAGRLFGEPGGSCHPLPEFLEGCPVPTYCLSPRGVAALRRMLVCVGALFPDITHSPLLPALAALLLHYSEDEARCFESLSRLLASNAPHAAYIDQSFLAHQASCMTFGDLASKHCPAAHKLIAGAAENVLEVYSEWLSWLFPGLPFGYAVRVLDVFLLEGQKVLYRIALALLRHFRLSAAPAGPQGSDIRAQLQAFARNIAEHVSVDKLLERAFGIRLFSRKEIWLLHMANRKALLERGITVVQRRPFFHLAVDMQKFSSSTVTAQEMRLVWSWIPERFSLFPPLLLFSTSEDGCSLQRFYSRCEGYEPTVLLIKTTEGEVSVSRQGWAGDRRGDPAGSSWSSQGLSRGWDLPRRGRARAPERTEGRARAGLGSLCPRGRAGSAEDPQRVGNRAGPARAPPAPGPGQRGPDPALALAGGGGGQALALDANLLRGRTERCETFDNPPLCRENFQVQLLEVWGFQSA